MGQTTEGKKRKGATSGNKTTKKKVYLLLDSMSQPKSQWMLLSQNLAITYSTTSKKRYPTKALFEKQES
jgi:hypothetical protein